MQILNVESEDDNVMGLFFKNKRNTKNSSDNNITITAQSNSDIKISIDLLMAVIKEMRSDIKSDLREINDQVKRSAKRIDIVEGEVANLKVRMAVVEKVLEHHKESKGKK